MTEVEVWIGGPDDHVVRIGRLWLSRRRGTETASFRYDDGWLGRPGAYPIDPQLPLTSGSFHTGPGQSIFRALADSAPDRWGVELALRAERRRAEREHTTPRSLGEADYLLAVRDLVRQGALRIREPGGGDFLAPDDAGIPPLVDLPRLLSASVHLERDAETDDELRLLLQAGSSLGGARPKAQVLDHDRLVIAKFPRVERDPWSVIIWEDIALAMARDAGITVAASRLVRADGLPVLLLDRFDRGAGGTRIGYVSALTMLEASDNDRRSYTEIAEVIETSSSRTSDDLRELWRRVAFSILVSNADDHLRNHGFLRSGAGWALSPAFDLNPAPDSAGLLTTAIETPGDRQARIEHLVDVAPAFRVADPGSVLRTILDATASWRERADQAGVGDEIPRLAPAFEHEQREAAESIAAGHGR